MNQITLTFSNSLLGLLVVSTILLIPCLLLCIDVFRKIEIYFSSNQGSIFQRINRIKEVKVEISLLLIPLIVASFLLNLFYIYKFWPLLDKMVSM